ncbi:hypothetical protein J2Z21_009363 [Streptomyces griseochromogenes]|uniref:Uncharacterized protein n=1 Tax=Streptomyces griseochromogenes TaxID=68214 RepID=A0ABS4M9J3_9ACTN|nr:hypothetical protein [Streptomyces griseochromogenes]MBP2056345.1 hypothetical protein [Streptomyces griseochromogenes]
MLRRTLKYGRCTAEATRTGGAIIEREVRDGGLVAKKRSITLEPVKPVGSITANTRGHLAAIDAESAPYLVTEAMPPFQSRVGRISAGVDSIPPAATARLVDRGLVTVGPPWRSTSNGYLPETRATVAVSLAARLAMLAQDHRTYTIAPAGYVKPLDIGHDFIGRNSPRGGVTYDRRSPAGCSCRTWSATSVDGRDDARRLAREHRQQMTAEFIASLG